MLVVLSTSLYMMSRSRQQMMLGCCFYAQSAYWLLWSFNWCLIHAVYLSTSYFRNWASVAFEHCWRCLYCLWDSLKSSLKRKDVIGNFHEMKLVLLGGSRITWKLARYWSSLSFMMLSIYYCYSGSVDEHMYLLLPALVRLFRPDVSNAPLDIRRAAIKTLGRLLPCVQVFSFYSSLWIFSGTLYNLNDISFNFWTLLYPVLSITKLSLILKL